VKHRVAGRRLDRTTEHRISMFKNMVTSLLRHERIETTAPKAKELRRIAEKVITLGKKGSPHSRRLAYRQVRDVEVLNKLFDTIGPRFASRPGGYTRVVRTRRRPGDAAEMAIIELVERSPEEGAGEKAPAPAKAEKAAPEKPSRKAAQAAKAEAETKAKGKSGAEAEAKAAKKPKKKAGPEK
jgi:large subunit ribosomal protein L17